MSFAPAFLLKSTWLPLLLAIALVGCSQTSQKERSIPLKGSVSLNEARTLLQNYSKGAPLTSEAESFDSLVEGVRKDNPEAADTLAEAFKKIRENPGSRAKVAKEALAKLPEPPKPEPATEAETP
ncbi:hypothetical protein [Bremerella cremea]|uniref:hypothetical protein n=1 Tax=Bremerella cremea TaxID=1031537 RepID=UPI0031EA119A